jgi:hypothetical protein
VLGRPPVQARTHADVLFFAVGSRFGPVVPADGFEETRARFARSALVPSRLFNDSSVWTTLKGESRLLQLAGQPRPSGYLLGTRDLSRLRGAPGEYRRSTGLERLTENEYEWTVRDELAVGGVSPDELGAALTALHRGAERIDPVALRSEHLSTLPRTSAALGRLFTLDSIALAPAANAGTRVTLRVTLDPERIAADYPDFSRFLERYVTRTRFNVIFEDPDSIRWWTASLEKNRLTLDYLVHRGRLSPLEGPPRRMPDHMRVRIDVATTVRIFGVGLSNLVGDVSIRRAPRHKSFTIFFPREPDWHFPLLVERFIRAPLRRPFAGDGVMLAFSAQRAGGSTMLVRDYRIAVQESAIVRWIGGLGSTAIGDFRQRAEAQYEQFIGELFVALRQDVAALPL